MDIPLLSMSMANAQVQSNFGVAMLSKSLDTVEDSGDSMVKMLEQSVTPNLGGTIDISI
ncbi:MAG: YjfB family protein [Lachnospiraceae bacterium]|nr:YjfB family protein [Lachnospiraceae bacterium]